MAYITTFKREHLLPNLDEKPPKKQQVIDISDDADEDVEGAEGAEDDYYDNDKEYFEDEEEEYIRDNDDYDIVKPPVAYVVGQTQVLNIDNYSHGTVTEKNKNNFENRASNVLQMEIERRLMSLIGTYEKRYYVPFVYTNTENGRRVFQISFDLNNELLPENSSVRNEQESLRKLIYAFDLWKNLEALCVYLQNIADHGVAFASANPSFANDVGHTWTLSKLSIDGLTIIRRDGFSGDEDEPVIVNNVVEFVRKIYANDDWEFKDDDDHIGHASMHSTLYIPEDILAPAPPFPEDLDAEFSDFFRFHFNTALASGMRWQLKDGSQDKNAYSVKIVVEKRTPKGMIFSVHIVNRHKKKMFFERFTRNGMKRFAYRVAQIKNIDVEMDDTPYEYVARFGKINVYERPRKNEPETLVYSLENINKLSPHSFIHTLCAKKTEVDGRII